MTLLSEASFLVTPNGYKEDKLYAAIPTNGNGDMTFTRTTTATRVNEAGLVELVPYNIFLRSQEFDNAIWTKGSGVSVTANTTIAPDGTLTADTLIGASSVDWGLSSLRRQPAPLSSSTTYTLSMYVKSLGSTTFQTSIRNNNVGGQVTVSHSINSDTWTRVVQTYTTTPTQTLVGIIFGGTDGDVAIWGVQLEAGAYPTSYIPTTNIAVQRDADAVSKTGISDLINSEEGVLFIEFKTLSETGTFRQFNLSKDSGNRIYITKRGDNGNLEFRMANPSGNLNFSFAENTTNDFVKVAFRYGLNDFAVFIDGVNKNVTSTGNVFASGTLNTLEFDSPLSQPFFGKVKQLQVYKTALSDPQCQALTTL